MNSYQVIIVGGGPVGVGLAVELGLRGITSIVVERHAKPQRIPKGQNLTHRTLEHFHFWNIEKELRAVRRMPDGYPISGVTTYGDLMSDYWVIPPQRQVVRPYYFTENERICQYDTEDVLRAKAATVKEAELLLGWQATKISQDANGVRVTIEPKDGGASRVLEGAYVVGCDGGHSLVREQMGIPRKGTDFDQLMALAVFKSQELHDGLKRFPPQSTYNALRPDLKGYWQFFGRVDGEAGWFFHAPVPADTTTENYDFQALVERAAGFRFKAEFEHVGFWNLRVAVADHYQAGRAFIAGDAAHSHPPYGGFGLNNGLEDITNLGWKLAAKFEGWGSDELLASYSPERSPVFKDVGENFIAAGIEKDRVFLDKYSPQKDKAEFEEAWKARAGNVPETFLSYEPNYEGSPVVFGPPGGKSGAQSRHMHKARAGHHLSPQKLSSGRNVFEELGAPGSKIGFSLVALGVDDGVVRGFEEAAKSLRVPMKVIRDSYDGGREVYESKLILVRPDQFIAWCGNEAPQDAKAVLAKAVGRG